MDNTKIRRGWDILFLNYFKIKISMWVSYSFKAAFFYISLSRSMHFWCHDSTLKKIFSKEKLNLTLNKQTNFHKLGPLSWVFQIVLRGWWMGNLSGGNFSIGWWEYYKEWIWPLKPFSKLKATFCKYQTLITIKISMSCAYKEYEGKTKMVQEQWLQLNIKFLLGYNMKIVI